MKKFYKLVSIEEKAGAYYIHLDGRPVKCPSGQPLYAASKKLAEIVQQEWSAQGETIIPDTMPITQIITTQLDRVSRERQAMEIALLKYIDTDLICYRAGDLPVGQREAQEQSWDPYKDWFEKKFDEKLLVTSDLVALSQSPNLHDKVKNYVTDLDDARFTAMQLVTSLCGSIMLGIAFLEKHITSQQIFDAAHVEEDFKAPIYDRAKYGLDPLEEKKANAMLADLIAAETFLNNL
ncbi:MAG: ATP12 chaperone family protein [Micavibrio sp.]|nr:ATP12 chaperone family protein [Micavibrio sp.]